ncbi:MAG: L-lactate permease [Defluviitaleaceae bacterium]|nr:L-lactate permease [Defluviitaleaceae bacterium]
MYAIFAALPIIVALVMMVGFRKKSGISLVAAWFASIILAIGIWNLSVGDAIGLTVLGFVSAINVLLIVFAAIFLLNAMIELKFIETIGNGFKGITQDRRIQIIIIAYLFGAFIEGAAGFGTPGALAAPLLVGLGVPVFFAALSSLMANYSPVLFGAVGIPPVQGFDTVRGPIEALGYNADAVFHNLNTMAAFTNIFVGSFVPFLIISAIVVRDGRKQGLKNAFNIFPLCLFAGVLFTVPVFILSHVGPEIPTLLSSLIALPVFIFAVKKGFLVPKEEYRFQDDPIIEANESSNTGISLVTAWSPYVIIAGLLALTRVPWLPIRDFINPAPAAIWATGTSFMLPNFVIAIPDFLGMAGRNFTFPILNNPGLFPFIPVAIIFLIARKTSGETIAKISKKTFNQLKNAILALCFGVALVQVMRFTNQTNTEVFSMTAQIARSLADAFGGGFPIVGPLIGAFGAFISGSHTVSNLMFYSLQLDVAQNLGMPIVLILIGQTSGASIGNMIAIHNAVAISATTGFKEGEGKLIAAAAVPFIICSLAISAIMFIYLALGTYFLA